MFTHFLNENTFYKQFQAFIPYSFCFYIIFNKILYLNFLFSSENFSFKTQLLKSAILCLFQMLTRLSLTQRPGVMQLALFLSTKTVQTIMTPSEPRSSGIPGPVTCLTGPLTIWTASTLKRKRYIGEHCLNCALLIFVVL